MKKAQPQDQKKILKRAGVVAAAVGLPGAAVASFAFSGSDNDEALHQAADEAAMQGNADEYAAFDDSAEVLVETEDPNASPSEIAQPAQDAQPTQQQHHHPQHQSQHQAAPQHGAGISHEDAIGASDSLNSNAAAYMAGKEEPELVDATPIEYEGIAPVSENDEVIVLEYTLTDETNATMPTGHTDDYAAELMAEADANDLSPISGTDDNLEIPILEPVQFEEDEYDIMSTDNADEAEHLDEILP